MQQPPPGAVRGARGIHAPGVSESADGLGAGGGAGDTLAAETEKQRRAAAAAGGRGDVYEGWRGMLLYARGEMEALIDFSEDQQFDETPADLLLSVGRQVGALVVEIGRYEEAGRRGELVRRGVGVALLGPVNVGKSSLMNRVVGREASIVSREAGTTRDVVEVGLDVGGYLCVVADTAGMRGGGGVGGVEEEGMRRARRRAEEADVVVVLAAVERGAEGWGVRYDEETLDIASRAQAALLILNKRDAVDDSTLHALMENLSSTMAQTHPTLPPPIAISCTPSSKDHIGDFISALTQTFATLTDVADQDLLGVTERQRRLLVECRHFLEAFMAEARGGRDIVLAAEYLRAAADCIAAITGRHAFGDVEDVLGVVFEK